MGDPIVALQALRCPFEHPCNNDNRDEANGEPDDNETHGFIAETECREDCLDDLDDEPCQDDVARSDTKDVAALELVEERHRGA